MDEQQTPAESATSQRVLAVLLVLAVFFVVLVGGLGYVLAT